MVGEPATAIAKALRYSDGDSTSGALSANLSLVGIFCVAVALSFLIVGTALHSCFKNKNKDGMRPLVTI